MTTRALLLVLGIVLSVWGAPAAAQSVFNAAGLGVPVEPLDARARALGTFGVGLRGAAFTPNDPAALGRLTISTGIMATQPAWVEYESESASGDFQGQRFPLIGIAYPLFDGMASIQIGSYLDQHYRAVSVGTVDLGSGPIESTDDFVQDGSVSTLNLGYSRLVTENISVGATVGRLAGSVGRTLTRSFSGAGTADVDTYVVDGTWSYSGYTFSGGVSADVGSRFRLAASVQVPSELQADASDQTEGADRSFDLPVQVRAGGSALVVSGLVVTGNVSMADWSVTNDELSGPYIAQSTTGYGMGLELTQARVFGRDAPLRFGFRHSDLPFAFEGGDATERIFAAGLGLSLNTTNDVVLAGIDLAVERGRRSGSGITEDFWRATISLLASGF
jgi:hypothetical protein